MTTALVHGDAWRRFDYGAEHPLRMERLGLTWRLMEAYGLTTLAGAKVWAPEPADEAALARFHAGQYLEVLKAVSGGPPLPGGDPPRPRPGGKPPLSPPP